MSPMPRLPTIWAARVVAYLRSPATPELRSPKNSSSATIPPREIWISDSSSDSVWVNRSSVSEWASSPRAALRLMIDSTSSFRDLPTSQATVAWPDSWVAMVRRSASVYSTGWARPISSVSLACCTSSQDMLAGAPAQGPDQGLVEQVDQHGRAVAEGLGRQLVGPLPDRRLVRTTGQLVVQDLLPPGPARQVEGDASGRTGPGRSSAGSRSAARLVAPITSTLAGRHVRLAQRAVGRAATG